MKIMIYVMSRSIRGTTYWSHLYEISNEKDIKYRQSGGKFPTGVTRAKGGLLTAISSLKGIGDKYHTADVKVYVPWYVCNALEGTVRRSVNEKYVRYLKEIAGQFSQIEFIKIRQTDTGFKQCIEVIRKMAANDS